MKKKILFFDFTLPYLLIDSDFPVGGAAVQLSNWISGFLQYGYKIGILVPKGSPESPNSEIQYVETYNLNYGIRKLRLLYYQIPNIYKAIKGFEPNYLYHGVPGITSFFLAIICRRLNIKFVLRISNDFLTDEQIKYRYNYIERKSLHFAIKLADSIICQNSYQYENLVNKYSKEKIHKLHNPYNLKNIKPIIVSRSNYVSWVGVFQYQKNLKLLLSIAISLPEVEFRIAGKSWEVIDKETKEALEGLKRLPNVKFVGYLGRKEVVDFISESRLLLNTSRYEGFTNTFLEAFSVGTPIVCPSNVDPDNIIQNYNLGIVSSENNGLKEAILNILNDREYSDYSKRIIKYLKDFHDINQLTYRLINFINR